MHKELQHQQTKIKELYAEYVKANGSAHGVFTSIARSLGLDDLYKINTIRHYLTGLGIHKPNQRQVENNQRKYNPTVASIEAQEQELERQLHEVQEKKQALIEAKALKIVNMVNDQQQPVVVIRKEGMSLAVSIEDAFLLVEKLEAHLAALPA